MIAGASSDENFYVPFTIGYRNILRILHSGEIFLPPAFHQSNGFGIEDIDRDLRAFEDDPLDVLFRQIGLA